MGNVIAGITWVYGELNPTATGFVGQILITHMYALHVYHQQVRIIFFFLGITMLIYRFFSCGKRNPTMGLLHHSRLLHPMSSE